jgi:hypothetical protein
MKTRLQEIQQTSEPWAGNRAGYILAVQQQLDQGDITQEQAEAWMLDLVRNLDTESNDPALASEIRNLARQIGDIQ